MVAMLVLFGVVVLVMVTLGVSSARRHREPFTELGAQELQAYTRPFGHDAPRPYGMRDGRPSKVVHGKLAAIYVAG
ncbi:MAG: hypothetical protein AAGA17_19445 [Actinomycetota bacterium]